MKLKSLTIKGLVPFPELQTVRFPTGKRKVAITGENGAGKTTLLDCIPMALFGSAPNRKGLYESFRGTDGLIDLEWEMGGREYRIKRMINANSRTQKPWFYVDGVPVTEGKASEFEAAVASTVGISESGFLASVYHAQNGKGNPLGLNDRERRDLLTEVLGLHRFESPYQAVSDEVSRLEREVAALVNQKRGLESTLQDAQALAGEKDTLAHRLLTLQGEIVAKEQAIQAAMERLAAAKANAQNLDELERQRRTLDEQIKSDRDAIAQDEACIRKNQAELLDQADAIRAAVMKIEEYQAEIRQCESEREATLAELQAEREERQSWIQRMQAQIDEESLKLQDYTDSVRKQEQIRDRLIREQDQLLTSIKALKPSVDVLGEAPCQGETQYYDVCPLLANAKTAEGKIQLNEARLAELEGAIQQAEIDRTPVERQQGIVTELQGLLRERQQEPASPAATERVRQVTAVIMHRHQLIGSLESLAKNAPYLEDAEARVAQYRQNVATTQIRLTSNEEALAAILRKIEDAADLSKAVWSIEREKTATEVDLRERQQEQGDKTKRLAEVDLLLSQNEHTQGQIQQIDDTLNALSGRLALASLLKEGLGPKGARALKIDAAGPEISELVNALLRECYGSKFTVAIKTLRELQSGDQRESLQFAIIDNATGEETVVENKSGGEQALIKEVISLALCIYQRRQAGVDTRTLIRDECSAPLSEANTELYLRMLDKACEIGGFDQVLYVSHKSVAQQMADAVIAIKDGRVTVSGDLELSWQEQQALAGV